MAVPGVEPDLPGPLTPVPRRRRRRAEADQARPKFDMPDSARYASAALTYLALPAAVAGWLLADAHEVPPQLGAVLGYAVHQLVVGLLLVPLLVRVSTVPCPELRRGRLVALGAAMGAPVRDVRLWPARRGEFLGVGAYSLVPNRVHLVLAEGVTVLSPAELDAVVAHQLGRARSRVCQVRIPVGLMAWSGLALGFGRLAENWMAAALITLVSFLGGFFAQTWCQIVGERQADRHAAAVVGARALADALERRHRLGGIYPPGFSLWLLLTYPQYLLDRRLAVLRDEPPGRPQP
ncbi:hypothetical protein [Frankia sp. QA3]|uniref:hypothetical protein n=1 Tax=Frankia sp. QA3 TaxID=710111 RepID=UPI000269C272|nr:hypothetical protein [Frankia sp. QA3]EIV91698.1 hypothetical protein FraQA3DRAFT_1163 [Frankia sp. QA3]